MAKRLIIRSEADRRVIIAAAAGHADITAAIAEDVVSRMSKVNLDTSAFSEYLSDVQEARAVVIAAKSMIASAENPEVRELYIGGDQVNILRAGLELIGDQGGELEAFAKLLANKDTQVFTREQVEQCVAAAEKLIEDLAAAKDILRKL